MENKKHEVMESVDFINGMILKDLGVIEFLEREIEVNEGCIRIHKANIEKGIEVESHKKCVRDIEFSLKCFKDKIETRVSMLKDFYNYDYYNRCFVKDEVEIDEVAVDEEHEMWLLEQQEGNYKGGTQSWDM